MKLSRVFAIVAGVTVAAMGCAFADDPVHTYTSEELDRMFGPAYATPTDPVDKSSPEDWRWVEQFLDRQYARVDADRQYELNRGALDIAAGRDRRTWTGYGEPIAWGLGYPASTWWNSVWGHYAYSTGGGYRGCAAPYRNPYAWATGENSRYQVHGGGNNRQTVYN
jgi:hypothetical protein